MSIKFKAGDKAPVFISKTYEDQEIDLHDYLGNYIIVLYFYPRDNTPGCTKEACSMRDKMNVLEQEGIKILGVSTDSVSSHEKFRDKYDLNFPLISDQTKNIVKAYGVDSAFGTASRKTFLIGKDGLIKYRWDKVNTSDHANEVLNKVIELGL